MKTIRELREMEVKRLHAIKGSTNENASKNYNTNYWEALNLSIDECEEEKRIMNIFYRLSALSGRVCDKENSQAIANGSKWAIESLKEMETKEEKTIKRLNNLLKEYGLQVYYCGIYPSIGTRYEHGGVNEVIQRHYYQ